MTLQGFSFGSAAKILDAKAGKESDGCNVSFRFGDGYDFGAAAGAREALREAGSGKSATASAVEADAVEVA